MSLGAEARYGRSSSGSRSLSSSVFDSFRGNGDFTGAAKFFFCVTMPSPAPPSSQTTLCAPALLFSRLKRINPTMSTTCTSAMRVTLVQKRRFFGIALFRLSSRRDPNLHDLRSLSGVDQCDQFFPGQVAVRPHHNGNVRIGALDLAPLRTQ